MFIQACESLFSFSEGEAWGSIFASAIVPLSFVIDMCKDELDNNVKWDEEGNVKIHTQDLYKMFEVWCVNNGTSKNTRKNFMSELKSFGLVEHDNKIALNGIAGKRVIRYGYHLNQNHIETLFKKYMKNEEFSFSRAT